MDACKRIFSNTHGQNFLMQCPTCPVRSSIYFQTRQSKLRINVYSQRLEFRRGLVRDLGHGRWKIDRRNKCGGRGIGGYGGGGHGDNPDIPYNTWTIIDIQDISRYFISAGWDSLQGDGQAYVSRQRRRVNYCGRCGNNCECRGRGCGRGIHILETDTDWSDFVCGVCGRAGRMKHEWR